MIWIASALLFGGVVFWIVVAGAVGWLLADVAIHALKTTVFIARIHRTGNIKKSRWFRHHLRLWAHFFRRPTDRVTFTAGGVAYWPGREEDWDHEPA